MGNKNIYALTDYKGSYESKNDAIPYNSGMDKELLNKYFAFHQVNLVYMFFGDVMNYETSFWKYKTVIYTSSEDTGYYYKSFIEDVICYLELVGANVIPAYKYLKANNNKVFMELVRHSFNEARLKNVLSKVFGTFEEMERSVSSFTFPLVYKEAAGAMSHGVGLAQNQHELINKIKKASRTPNLLRELWEFGRSIKHKGYIRESKYRNKFIVQNLVVGLKDDFKVLIFGDKYYVLQRYVKKGDFRASGSGIRNFVKEIPQGILEYAHLCKKVLSVPFVSLDIAYNGKSFFLIEFQCLYFGSFTLTNSDFYWNKTVEDFFVMTESKSILEEEYARSIVNFVL
jgi:hypothetical protein